MTAVNLVSVTTITRIPLYSGQPGTSNGTLYTVPASTNVKIVSIIIANTTTANATITINVVPSGGSASASNQIMSAVTISPNTTVTFDTPFFMGTSDFIAGLQGTTSALTVTISGETYA